MKLFDKLLDAAGALAIATAVLGFWGYYYYATYTEALGVPFHGITMALQDYLTASWLAVATLFLAIVFIVLLLPLADGLTDLFANWIRKKLGKPPLSGKERDSGSYSVTAILFLSACAFVFGMRLMSGQARADAKETLRASQEVTIWNSDGEWIPGRFVYLRNFGSTLLVRELNDGNGQPLGFRFFKESAFSSYSLLPPGWSAKGPLTVDVESILPKGK